MAVPAQQPPVGGLGQVKPQTEAPAANPAAAAARTSALEQAPEQQDFLATVVKDRQEAMKALNAQIEKLKSSLDSRMNPPFDTSLMAAASGFLKPTRTGSFGESLGSAMEGYSTDANKVLERRAGIDKTNLELLQKQADLQKQNMIMQHEFGVDKQFGGDPTLKTGVALAAPGSPARPAPAGMPQPAMPPSQPGRPPLTLDRVRQAMAIEPAYGKRVEDQFKLEQSVEKQTQERYISTPQGIFDRQTGKYLDVTPPQPEPKEYYYGPGVGKIPTSPEVNREYQNILKEPSDAARNKKLTDFYVRQNLLRPSTDAGPNTLGLPSTLRTPEQKDLDAATAKARMEASVKADEASKTVIYDAAQTANKTINIADSLHSFATDPSTQRAFGLLRSGGVMNAIGLAVSEGLTTPTGSIKFPGVESAIGSLKLNEKERDALLVSARQFAELELNYARTYLQAQGAVSNSEREIVRRIGGSTSDSANAIAAKAELMKSKAILDKITGEKLYEWEQKNPNKLVRDFQYSPDYKNVISQYDKQISAIQDRYFPPTTPKPAATTTSPATATVPPPGESLSDRFKREKKEREAKGQP